MTTWLYCPGIPVGLQFVEVAQSVLVVPSHVMVLFVAAITYCPDPITPDPGNRNNPSPADVPVSRAALQSASPHDSVPNAKEERL